jgi:hypothetical protein
MTRHQVLLPIAVTMTFAMVEGTALANKTYYADEGLTYSGNCGGVNLSSGFGNILLDLQTDGWSGTHYTDGSAWPQDFRESCSSGYGQNGPGYDNLYGDTKALTMFSGHGDQGDLFFSVPHNTVCDNYLGANSRLGSMNGSQAVVGLWYSCETLGEASLGGGANWQWTREQLGFWGDEYDGLAVYIHYFYLATGGYQGFLGWVPGQSNGAAWINEWMGYQPGLAIAYGTNAADCWNTYNNVRLKDNTLMTPRGGGPSCGSGQPAFTYCYNKD